MAVANDAIMTAGDGTDAHCRQADNATGETGTGITVGASATLIVLCGCWQGGSSVAPTSRTCTWNSTSTNEAVAVTASSGVTRDTSALYTLVSPASGNNTIVWGWTNTQDFYGSAASFTGTDTTTGYNATNNATQTGAPATAITVTSSSDGATIAVFTVNGNTPTVDKTQVYAQAPLDPGGAMSYALGGASNTHNFTGAGGSNSALVGINVIAGAGGGATTRGTPFGHRGTAFNGGRTFNGILQRQAFVFARQVTGVAIERGRVYVRKPSGLWVPQRRFEIPGNDSFWRKAA